MSEAHFTPNISYWVDSTPIPEQPSLEGTVEVEVAIVGAGIVGLTAARLLKRSGKTVAVIEMDRIVRGVTGYTTAKITAGHSLIYQQLERMHGEEAARAYAMANQGALEKMSGWIEEEAIACDFERRPNFVYTERSESKSSIQKEVEAARRAGLEVTLVTDTDLPFEIVAAVRLDNQAQFHPLKYLLHFGRDIIGDGSHIFESCGYFGGRSMSRQDVGRRSDSESRDFRHSLSILGQRLVVSPSAPKELLRDRRSDWRCLCTRRNVHQRGPTNQIDSHYPRD